MKSVLDKCFTAELHTQPSWMGFSFMRTNTKSQGSSSISLQFNPSTGEAETDGSTKGQPGLQKEFQES